MVRALERLELRVERLQLVFRFTYAFHAREVRFECDRGEGFERVFPETFSFNPQRHDPAELYLQFDDLARKPALLSPAARRRDVQVLMSRLVIGVPRYLERVLERLEEGGRLDDRGFARVYEDVALLAQILMRFIAERAGDDGPGLRMSTFHLRKLAFRSLAALMHLRVTTDYVDGYVEGSVDPVDPADDLSEAGFFYTLESGDQEAVNRSVLRLAERAFYNWLEDVCLDEENRAFEIESSPFADRETEVKHAVSRDGGDFMQRARDLSPFLRRPGNRDCRRVLGKLEAWFLRQYDIHHSAAVIQHADDLERGVVSPDRVLSRHRTRNYAMALTLLASPFAGAALAYERAPALFDALCGGELLLIVGTALWFLLYRFCLKRNLTVFHASVPRIAAGIIVGYLPIFFIDEIWGLAGQSWFTLVSVATLLGFMTLLYLYVEVQRRLGNPPVAFARARQIFFLGVLQAFSIGLVITGLIGGFMAARNWGDLEESVSPAQLAETLPPFLGELPRVLGFEPFWTFPSAVFVMTFMSFFIGTFLQLMWEDLPITEPL